MRVLHVFKTYWPDTFGGVERTIDAIATSHLSYGIKSTVLSLSRSPREHSSEFNGHFALKAHLSLELASTGFSVDMIGKFSCAAKNADIVHYHFPWPMMDLAHFIVQHKKPNITTYHSDIVKQRTLNYLYTPLMRRFLDQTGTIVSTSGNYLKSSDVLQKYRRKVKVIPIGLRDCLDGDNRNESISEKPFFLFSGVLRYYKGIDVLLDAAPKVPCEILILGSGPLEKHLRDRVKSEGINNVIFVGPLIDSEKMTLLSQCRAFIFPSCERSEAFGLSLVEAAMFGCPLISTELGTGTSYVNLNGLTGLVVPARNSDALAEAMNFVLESPETARTWGAAARQRYLDLFTAEQMGRSYRDLYLKLLGVRAC